MLDCTRYAWFDKFPQDLPILKSFGFTVVALALVPHSISLTQFLEKNTSKRLAIMMGHEGDGLTKEAIAMADVCVKIEMAPDAADSLNVSASAAVALYTIAKSLSLL